MSDIGFTGALGNGEGQQVQTEGYFYGAAEEGARRSLLAAPAPQFSILYHLQQKAQSKPQLREGQQLGKKSHIVRREKHNYFWNRPRKEPEEKMLGTRVRQQRLRGRC